MRYLKTHLSFSIPYSLLFSFSEISSINKSGLYGSSSRNSSVSHYNIWTNNFYLQVKTLVSYSFLQRINNFFFPFAHCGLRTDIFFRKRERERSSFYIFLWQTDLLNLPFMSSSYINVKYTCQPHSILICKLKIWFLNTPLCSSVVSGE